MDLALITYNGCSRAESIWEINNYAKYINQFPPNTIKSIRQYERINKKICRQKMSIILNEICINEEMLPIYMKVNMDKIRQLYISYLLLSSQQASIVM